MKRRKKRFTLTRSRLLTAAVLAAVAAISLYTVITRWPANTSTNTISPQSAETSDSYSQKQDSPDAFSVHKNIIATVFWVGEAASADNDYIQNRSSAWQDDWMSHYGGEDNPNKRCGYKPCGFTPKENSFYVALPFNDLQENGEPKPADILRNIPWYNGQTSSKSSLVKNRWVAVTRNNKTVYLQWQDVGPFGEDDVNYVFGSAQPQEKRAGIDLSPAGAAYLGIDGRGTVSWKFVDASQVPLGPWKEVVTTSGIDYN